MIARLPIYSLFGTFWAVFLCVCVAYHLTSLGWHVDGQLRTALLPYLFGGFFGGAGAFALSERFHRLSTVPTRRFGLFFASLAVLTIGFAAATVVIHFRLYYAQWHAPFPSIAWAFQTVFTAAGSAYLFAVTGVRPLLPWGLLGLFVASLCFSRGWIGARR
ncbi:MAG: hypothetical protein AAGF28_07245 [Pseudomonadota bacterium]